MRQKENLREAYGKELLKCAKENNRIIALDADLCGSTMSVYIEKEIPERFFEMGIAEQNMISVAAGLALVGKIPFVHSFAVFAAGQAYNQIRQGIALPKLNVKIIGSSGGLSDFGDGATHQSVEDISIMRAIPNMVVIVPVDAIETRKVVRAVIKYNGPVYIRITRNDLVNVTNEEDPFEIGKIFKVAEGNDITVFACGIMVSQALEARKALLEMGISARVVNVSTIKPLDIENVKKFAKDVKGVITAEENNIIGGLGGAISEALSEELIKIKKVGINDEFGQSANCYEDLINYYGLTPKNIVNAAKSLLN
ncbi:MAG: transketolase family protein [Actinobacteria bacterium]|nr:transketolase family protein [Actinomycetota bacterium]